MAPSGQASREGEVPLADFDGGMNIGGACAPGIGVNIDGGPVSGEPQQFTLQTQFEGTRTPQLTSHIGNTNFVNRSSVEWPSSGGSEGPPSIGLRSWQMPDYGSGGVPSPVAASWLLTLDDGWTEGDPTP
jgi:hypothetical protein